MEDNSLKLGSHLKNGEYCILKVLGQGGFGVTYEAEQTSLGRKVAVKEFFMKDYCDREDGSSHVTLSTSSSSRELVERFRTKFVREARMIASLDHEHIVKVIDIFEENGTAYYVMEHIGGGCLGNAVKEGDKFSESEALGYIRQIASALSYLHGRGIIHFDVKPSNVLMTESGKLKLIDFGISKHYDEAGVQTSSTPVGISKGYAPLEQYQQGSDIKSFTPATDIYSLGATLYALLSGTNPPEASIVNEDGVPFIEGVSPNIMHAIEKAMQPRRKDRPQTIETFLELLDAPMSKDKIENNEETEVTVINQPVSDSRQKSIPPVNQQSNKKPWAKFGLIGGIILLVILSLIFLLPHDKQQKTDIFFVEGVQEYTAEFESAAAEKEFKIEKNFEDRWTYSGVPEWGSAKGAEGKFIFTISDNTTKEDRKAVIEFKKKDGDKVLATLTVNQKAKQTTEQKPIEKEYGSIKLTSSPSGATIWIDGRNTKKTTPDIIEDIAVGNHKVVLKLAGYEDANRTVSVKRNGRSELSCNLSKVAMNGQVNSSSPTKVSIGSITVTSTPSDAEIWIDGTNLQKNTPVTIENLTAGTHTVEVKKSGYQENKNKVTVVEGKSVPLNLNLEPLKHSQVSISPSATNEVADEDEVIPYQKVEKQPSFMGGGPNEFTKWVNQRLVYPEIAKENGVQGRVTLQFTIEKDGSVDNVEVFRGVDPLLDKEAVRVVSSSPKWTPGMQDGRYVRVTYTFPVIFQLR